MVNKAKSFEIGTGQPQESTSSMTYEQMICNTLAPNNNAKDVFLSTAIAKFKWGGFGLHNFTFT